ncbi:MAG: DUF1294 domain-containing protein [Moraxella sp.]|nr:DUF1294 domain-containing protein [Moraxella sp.]
MEKHQGHIVKFDDKRGFGFIQFKAFDKELFFHIKGFKAHRNPVIGEQVLFDVEADKQGRPMAVNIQEALSVAKKQQEQEQRKQKQQAYKARQERQEQKHGVLNLLCGFALIYFMVMTIMSLTSGVPNYLPFIYVVMSVISFVMYYQDKIKAQNSQWRTPESTLHFIDVLGGWIGATFAHKLLNHKTTKAQFRTIFYATIAIHVMVIVGLLLYHPLSPS